MSASLQTEGGTLTYGIGEYERQFEQIRSDAEALTAGLTHKQFNWRPAAGVWSISECLCHLNISGEWWLRELDRAMEAARQRGWRGDGKFRVGWLASRFIRSNEPPVRRRFRAPRRFTPVDDQPLSAVRPTFMHLQSQFIERLKDAAGLDLTRTKVSTPVPLLKLSLGPCFGLIAAHERRHLWQARQVRNEERFPLS